MVMQLAEDSCKMERENCWASMKKDRNRESSYSGVNLPEKKTGGKSGVSRNSLGNVNSEPYIVLFGENPEPSLVTVLRPRRTKGR